MPGNYTITTRASGTILTAAIYNADHQNHVDNNTPQGLDDYSANVAQMQTQTDPGAVGTESLATSTAQEIERIRFALARLGGTTYWYQQPGSTADAMKNRVINGDMRIDQRYVGAITTPAASLYLIDRWQLGVTQNGKISGQRSTAVPNTYFVNSLKCFVASAFSPGAADVFGIFHAIEGYNIADLGWGAAGAKTVTLSFWAYSTLAGTYAIALRNAAGNRSYIATYTLLATTFTYVTIVIPGDTTGTWVTTNAIGISIAFDLGSGSNYNGVASNWNTGNFLRTAGSVNWVAQAAAQFFVTGVQLEVNNFATNFAVRPFGVELGLCQRYYTKSYPLETAVAAVATSSEIVNFSFSSNGWTIHIPFHVPMRAAPTLTTFSPVSGAPGVVRNDNTASDIASSSIASERSTTIFANASGAQQQLSVHFSAEAEL